MLNPARFTLKNVIRWSYWSGCSPKEPQLDMRPYVGMAKAAFNARGFTIPAPNRVAAPKVSTKPVPRELVRVPSVRSAPSVSTPTRPKPIRRPAAVKSNGGLRGSTATKWAR